MIIDFLKQVFAFDPNSPLLFTQFYFWAFFAFVFAGLALLQNKILLRNTFLCFVSLFFYYKTSGLFVLILIFTTIFNFFQGKLIYKSLSDNKKHLYLVLGLIVNLFFLCYFKYAYFITDVINNILGSDLKIFNAFAWVGNMFDGNQRFDVGSIMLPVGISFYTFQNISYLMDIYRKRIEPVKEILNFGFYVTFFPGLVAGPIVRANQFVPQIYKKYYLGRKQFGIAVFWIMNGLAKKIILSDYIAVNFVDRVFTNPTMFSGFENFMGLIGYSLQVYADFSGYTDIAIGVAMLMGFYLPKNFDSPYKATNAGNFWKRWHISLSKWLQDYLYIPLGGNRTASIGTYLLIITIALIALILSGSIIVGALMLLTVGVLVFVAYKYPEKKKKIITNINLMNVMLVGGIWHGASWNFMIWGGLNGLGIIIYKFWRDWSITVRIVVVSLLTLLAYFLSVYFPMPVFNIAVVWIGVITIGTFIRFVYSLIGGNKYSFKSLGICWAVFQTFIFISFTRLFFRAGSNLDPAEANQAAWNTAQDMVNQIGGKWDLSLLGSMLYEYRTVFSIILLGMIIHWLPDNFKRRYRIMFAKMPLAVMALIIIVSVFIIYQFITADLQTFIYFQF
ncbi:alginate O-acetyltransferase complex protein AlgI [Dysgonomonadaceae bacterium PH5-43]|nr:alginate O-acetyltransferase complex protein AlgI [Dysgonomonadaceae bacterium PH5-43]